LTELLCSRFQSRSFETSSRRVSRIESIRWGKCYVGYAWNWHAKTHA